MTKALLIGCLLFAFSLEAFDITVDASAGRKPISPWIYGKNNSLSDDPQKPTSSAELKLYREAGLRMLRECSGNNNTKYNWRRKLTSAPDWYNNVYLTDWDYMARVFLDSTSNTHALMGFQLIGKVAANQDNNFNDWGYNSSQWWSGVNQNLAGGGTVNTAGGDSALVNGNPDLYLMDWPAESTTAILDHWFGSGGLGYDKNRIMYWNMDNEPEIWFSTHDDVMKQNITAEEFMQKYFAVAKLARQKFPGIKLVGFGACNEWQWYTWNNKLVTVNEGGVEKKYCWLEYFIKRIAEEQTASGVRLLDVLNFHCYAGSTNELPLALQLHRIWFDTTYVFPQANGCKFVSGEWDHNQTKEYIMERGRRWLDKYCGTNHGVTLGVTEIGNYYEHDPSAVAVWYASQLGTFADEGCELFTVWTWKYGLWEVMHLFSRYCGTIRVKSSASPDSMVSAYSSINTAGDSMTIILVNRDQNTVKNATITINGFTINGTSFPTLQLDNLQNGQETFKSHTDNALKAGTVTTSGNTFSLDLPTISVTAVIITGKTPVINTAQTARPVKLSVITRGKQLCVQSNIPVKSAEISIYDCRGKCARTWNVQNLSAERFSLEGISSGRYVVTINKKAISGVVAVIK